MKKLTLIVAALFIAGASFAHDGDKKACCKKGEGKEAKACCKKGEGKKECSKETAEKSEAPKQAPDKKA